MTQPTPDLLIQRLRDGALEQLIELCIAQIEQRPVADLLPAELLAERSVAALQAAAAAPELERRLAEQLELVRGSTIMPRADGRAFPPGETLRDHIPEELTAPVEALLSEPYLPDRELVLRLLDHPAMHSLIQEVLHATLVRFVRKMRSLEPTKRLRSGLGKRMPVPSSLSRLKDLGSGVVSVVGSEIESQLDQRVGEYVTQVISAVLAQVATLLTAPERAETMGDWRAYGMRVVMETELEAFAREARKLEPEQAVATAARAVRSLAQREGLEDELTLLWRRALAPWEERALGELLGELGLGEVWRSGLRDWLSDLLVPVLDTTAFSAWLEALLGMIEES
jgi:hypothetical protein